MGRYLVPWYWFLAARSSSACAQQMIAEYFAIRAAILPVAVGAAGRGALEGGLVWRLDFDSRPRGGIIVSAL